MEKARCNTELYSNLRGPLKNVKPSNFLGSHQNFRGSCQFHAFFLGIDRKTVRRYRDMSQVQISVLIEKEVKRRFWKQEQYRKFTIKQLKEKPMPSPPQVHNFNLIRILFHIVFLGRIHP